MITKEQKKAAIFGVAIGDALGVPVEFQPRDSLKANPVTGMREYGAHYQPVGTWSDDTSMTLATLDVLQNYGLDYEKIMNAFDEWEMYAKYTATDCVFDMGNTCFRALMRYRLGIPALECGGADENDNGNGSLMRIMPAALYCADQMVDASIDEKLEVIHNISSLTHAHNRALIGCGIYSFVVWSLLQNASINSIYEGLKNARGYYQNSPVFCDELMYYSRVLDGEIKDLKNDEIVSSGYVVTSLEAAIWCLLNTSSFDHCVLKAVNLGRDTDTIAAIAGGLAGLLYGYERIPLDWRNTLKKTSMINRLCELCTFS